jgi:hypothetical protein
MTRQESPLGRPRLLSAIVRTSVATQGRKREDFVACECAIVQGRL